MLSTLTGHEAAVTQVDFSPSGGLIASCARDGTVRFWDVLSGLCVKALEEPGMIGWCPCHASRRVRGRAGYRLAGTVKGHTPELCPVAGPGEATSLALSRDGTLLLTSTRHGSIRLWDLRSADRPLQR